MRINYSLYLIMDDSICKPEEMLNIIHDVIDCGITCVQLRMKHSSLDVILHIGQQLLAILKPKHIPLIINDHIDIAKEINADGVHLGQTDKNVQEARAHLGKKKIIGLSIENIYQAQICADLDVNYFGVGPIYPTSTKLDAANPIGLDELTTIVKLLPKPAVAIGGIHSKNAQAVLQTGVAGIAVASAILRAPKPDIATRKLAEIITHSREKNA